MTNKDEMMRMNKLTMKHFSGVMTRFHSSQGVYESNKEYFDAVLDQALRNGVHIDLSVLTYMVSEKIDVRPFVDDAVAVHGISEQELQSTFYSDLEKIQNMSAFQRVVDQSVEYSDTYGDDEMRELFDLLGVEYNTRNDANEYLKSLTNHVRKLAHIKALTEEEMIDRMNGHLASGIAMNERDVMDMTEIYRWLYSFDNDELIELDEIANKEVQARAIYQTGAIPNDPFVFLRYVVYYLTDQAMLIKSDKFIQNIRTTIQESHPDDLHGAVRMFVHADEDMLIRLAGIFNRYKPIFLALREIAELRPYINKISKLSKKYHKPLEAPVLTEVANDEHSVEDVRKAAKNSSFQLTLRAAEALRMRLAYDRESYRTDEILQTYRIRNGKTFTKVVDSDDVRLSYEKKRILKVKLNILTDHIKEHLAEKLKGKVLVLPTNVNYALPTSNRQMIGAIPDFTYMQMDEIDDNFLIGFTWSDNIDVDLHATNDIGTKWGWDEQHHLDGGTYTGDMTGLNDLGYASEGFYIDLEEARNLIVSSTIYSGANKIDGRFFIARNRPNYSKNTFANNIVDTSTLEFVAPYTIEYASGQTIGYYDRETNRAYATNTTLPSYASRLINHSINQALIDYTKTVSQSKFYLNEELIDPKHILRNDEVAIDDIQPKATKITHDEKLGTLRIDEDTSASKHEDVEYIDLRPHALAKDTFTNLLYN